MRAHDYITNLAATGRYCFTSRDAREALDVSADATKLALGRLARKKRIASPARGFHVILPPEYRTLGCLPPEQFVPELMRWLNQPYYAGLLSAAQFHGAAHHRPQEFQVMLTKPRRPIRCGKVRVAFIGRARLPEAAVQSLNMPRGILRISTPEATAVDLVGFHRRAGGMDHVATLLAELAEPMDPHKLLAAAEIAPITWAQRLGYLLESLGAGNLVAPLKDYVRSNARRTVLLLPGVNDRNSRRANVWKLRVNVSIRMDEKQLKALNSTFSTLPYQMGNGGDLLKHGVLAEFVRWRCVLGTAIRLFDLFGGEPFDDAVPDRIVHRIGAMQNTALYKAQDEISKGRYYGSGKLVQRLADQHQGSEASVYVADRDSQRRKRLRESGLRMLSEIFPGIDSGPRAYDAYEALGRIINGTRAGDIVLIDPFDEFLPEKASETIPKMAEMAQTATLILFALNRDPQNSVGRQFDRLLERHFGGALIMTLPPLRDSPIRGESNCYVDLVLAGPETGNDSITSAEFTRRLNGFSRKLTAALGLSNRGGSMLRPRVVGKLVS